MLLPKIILTFEQDTSALGFTKQGIPSNPLTQFNYSSLQLKGYSPIASSFGISGGKII
jgi:hypothetical protein